MGLRIRLCMLSRRDETRMIYESTATLVYRYELEEV